jgi:hypothetical protein
MILKLRLELEAAITPKLKWLFLAQTILIGTIYR